MDELTGSVAVDGDVVGVVEESCDVMLGMCEVEDKRRRNESGILVSVGQNSPSYKKRSVIVE